MGKFYKEKLKKDMAFTEHMTDAADVAGIKDIKTIERLKWDYKRRLGNIVLKKVKYIRDNTFHYDTSKKRKTNDRYLKRKITPKGKSKAISTAFCLRYSVLSNPKLQLIQIGLKK